MLGKLQESNTLLDEIQKGLNDYLEKKRLFFARYVCLAGEREREIEGGRKRENDIKQEIELDTGLLINACFHLQSAMILHIYCTTIMFVLHVLFVQVLAHFASV